MPRWVDLARAEKAKNTPSRPIEESDNGASVEELLRDAEDLFILDRPIDARGKLLKALKKAPHDYRTHLMLGSYYLAEVGAFKLAYRYLRRAEKLFEDLYGSDRDGSLAQAAWQQHARLLYLLAEAQLNLDKYEASLQTLDRFGAYYWDDWYPGTRAWVLMKLTRTDEAIRTAQAGLLRGAEPGRTYNILGILLSLKGNLQLSLKAFAEAIRAEVEQGSDGQVSTPLNNIGEVYRELFADDLAEACWLKAVQFPDGCDHILPSLNLSILLVDELRLFAAERVLNDFEACFASHANRQDTEHRTLLALGRGRIALHSGNADRAADLLSFAGEQEQWFGKIGTKENDARFAVTIGLAQALSARMSVLRDQEYQSVFDDAKSMVARLWLRLRIWWLNRRAREISLDELADFEDLSIRHTDSMIEYPTLGRMVSGFPMRAFQRRISRMIDTDQRKASHPFYQLYLALNLAAHGEDERAAAILQRVLKSLRPVDRLARAEALAQLIEVQERNSAWWKGTIREEAEEIIKRKEELFALLPSQLRYRDLTLPISLSLDADNDDDREKLRTLAEELLSVRFELAPAFYRDNARYRLTLSYRTESAEEKKKLALALVDRSTNSRTASLAEFTTLSGEERKEIINKFIASAFSHTVDPPGEPLPEVELLKGIL